MTLKDYEALVMGRPCNCGRLLSGPVSHYDHPEGWEVEGFTVRQWIYATCWRGHQTPLWKIGITGTEDTWKNRLARDIAATHGWQNGLATTRPSSTLRPQ